MGNGWTCNKHSYGCGNWERALSSLVLGNVWLYSLGVVQAGISIFFWFLSVLLRVGLLSLEELWWFRKMGV